MAAVLRVGASSIEFTSGEDPAKSYLERLIKLIPAEIVGLYLAGRAAILSAHPTETAGSSGDLAYWIGWTAFCLLGVFLVRAWATSSRTEGLAPQWGAVAIAAGSFLVWVYSFGDVFDRLGWWEPLPATLSVLAWTFIAPLAYRPTAPQPGTAVGPHSGGRSITRPLDFTHADAEQAVLDSAQKLAGRRPSLSHTVSALFATEPRIRRLLSRAQDLIWDEHQIWVELADGSAQEVRELGTRTFAGLSLWVLDKVRAVDAQD